MYVYYGKKMRNPIQRFSRLLAAMVLRRRELVCFVYIKIRFTERIRREYEGNTITYYDYVVRRSSASRSPDHLPHGGLLSLNAWKESPTPQNIEMVA